MTNNINEVLLPFRSRVLANGEPFWINVCYVAFTVQNAGGAGYDHADPDEYAEFVQATYDHLGTFGLVPDTWEMILEPDNDPIWSPNKIGQAMVATGTRLQGAGYTPAFVAPSTTSMAAAWQYYDGLSAVSNSTDHLIELSYHRYFGANPTNLTAIRTRADAAGIPTSHLEYIGADYEDLHEDIDLGGNASWSQYVLAKTGSDDGGAYYLVDDTDPLNPVLTPGSRTPMLRQYMRYIRPGSVRYEATSDDAGLEPLGFVRGDGGHVVVGKVDAGETFFVRGLPAGTYGLQYTTTGSMSAVDLADATLIEGQVLTASLPARGVLTVYAK